MPQLRPITVSKRHPSKRLPFPRLRLNVVPRCRTVYGLYSTKLPLGSLPYGTAVLHGTVTLLYHGFQTVIPCVTNCQEPFPWQHFHSPRILRFSSTVQYSTLTEQATARASSSYSKQMLAIDSTDHYSNILPWYERRPSTPT